MASFYNDACQVDAKMALFQPELQVSVIDEGLNFYVPKENDEKLLLPHSIMNENVAINYRSIYNGYANFLTVDKNGKISLKEGEQHPFTDMMTIKNVWLLMIFTNYSYPINRTLHIKTF